jgi:hypothetical protein
MIDDPHEATTVDSHCGMPSIARAEKSPWPAVTLVSLLVLFVNVPLTTCLCGHQSWDALPANLAVLGATGIAIGKERTSLWRVVAVVVACGALLATFKVLCDILWIGHNAIFR